jgi:NAD(P)-dependent dehydrogenase (short-subunit alcohol dehydrogenase family)
MRLQDKVAIVTGGASGIGRAVAERFAAEGASVTVADYQDGADAVAAIVSAAGTASFIKIDVRDGAAITSMIDHTLAQYGGIDILVNGAGVLIFGTVLDTSLENWQRVIDINLTGTFMACKAALPHMIQRGGGSIINFSSSTGAHDAGGNIVAYVASKGGVTMLTKAMAVDHAKDNIRVNALCPGPTLTPMLADNFSEDALAAFAQTFPMKRLGTPQELAAAALFLASDEASFVTGAMLAVDGGQTAEI